MAGQSGKSGTHHAENGMLDDLAIFVAVAEAASFVGAARALEIPTSSVSRAVARLEDRLGVALLRRTSRRVTMTDEGRALRERSASHVEELRVALTASKDGQPRPSGVVRVTAPAFTGSTRIARQLADFARAHPDITIELDATNAIRDLLHDGYDFGIRVGPNADADFVARKLWQSAFALFASTDFVERELGGKKKLTRAKLERVACVVLRTPSVWRFVDASGALHEVKPRARFVVNDPRAAVDVARRGLGVVLAPVDAVGRSRELRGLVQLSTELGEPRPIELYVVYPSRRLLPLRVRLAIEHLATT